MVARTSRGARTRTRQALTIAVGVGALAAASAIGARTFSEWGPPQSAEPDDAGALNTEFNDGCPILSPDGLSLFIASNRPGGFGGQDIWVSRRASTTDAWGAPTNLGAPVNSPVDDFCPTPARGKRLFFVSRRDEPNGDIYVTRFGKDGYDEPTRLTEVNSPAQEWSPAYFVDEFGNDVLYFGSTRPGGPGGQDIYYSVNFGPAQLAEGELNTPFDDARPNVSRDGLEIVFDSNRPGTLGGPDIYTARRAATGLPWPAATHLAALSSPAPETRASLSWDGTFMLFGSLRAGGEGQADVYVTTRRKVTGANAD